MTTCIQMIGNAKLLEKSNKVAFLSSRKIAPEDVLRCYDWAAKVPQMATRRRAKARN